MVRRARRSATRVRAYGELAEAYDVIHRGKPYAQDARMVLAAARRYARRPLHSLLDVACGSGRHLEFFARKYVATGLDASPDMLARARRRAPGATLLRGRMESFRLGRRFDIVTCLFSSIGYTRSVGTLRRTLRNLARHTEPGGVVLVEPWLTPEQFRSGLVTSVRAESDELAVVRMNDTRRVGHRSVFLFHHLIGRRGTIRYAVERHELGLFDRPTMLAAFRAAGLRPRYLSPRRSVHRGLYVAVRPTAPSCASARRPRRGRRRRPSGS
jgi:SAM-dependent methyltransferase